MINTLDIYNDLKANLDDQTAHNIAKYIGKVYEDLDNSVTKTDFNDLKDVVQDLVEAQKRTEIKVEELAEAQKRTEIKVEELAEAQKRTEIKVEELAEAQKRTEEALAKLTNRVDRLENSVERLEKSHEKLVEAHTSLVKEHKKLAKQVGGLSETIGGDIEDIAYIVLHRVLGQKLGWQVHELKRKWVQLGEDEVEIDVFGQANDPKDPEKTIWIVGEAKHNLTIKEVEHFKRIVKRARKHLEGEIFPVCFCYRARPNVQEAIKREGFRMMFSYGELV